jgi:hypothetical protein
LRPKTPLSPQEGNPQGPQAAQLARQILLLLLDGSVANSASKARVRLCCAASGERSLEAAFKPAALAQHL